MGERGAPPTSCLPCVRGGAERMRSGGVVGLVQEKVACDRMPVPIRHLQPLSQGLWPCQLPFSIAGVSAETPLRHRSAGRARSDGRNHVPPVNPLLFRRRTREKEARFLPTAPCLPCVRGGAERMRSGGVVGWVQEKVSCNRNPVPIRHPQPLSQGLRPCQLPFSIAGVSAETPLRHRKAGRARSDGRNHVPPVNPLLFGRRTRDEKPSPAGEAASPSGLLKNHS